MEEIEKYQPTGLTGVAGRRKGAGDKPLFGLPSVRRRGRNGGAWSG